MNKVELLGRLARDPQTRWTTANSSQESMCIARYTLAVNRRGKDAGADFISCVAFGKAGEFAEKYLKKGMQIAVCGRITTGSYEKNGQRFYTTEVTIEEQEFAESKNAAAGQQDNRQTEADENGFMSIQDGIDEELPFN